MEQANTHTHTYTHAHTHAHHTYTHMYTFIYQGSWTEEKGFKKRGFHATDRHKIWRQMD